MTAARLASRLTVLMLFVAVVWYAALVTLAVRTANPPTLNARQLLSSDLIVIGTVSDDGAVQVDESFLGAPAKGPIKLVRDDAFPIGKTILPLSRNGDLYRITTTGLPGKADRMTYPLTDATRHQLDALLKH